MQRRKLQSKNKKQTAEIARKVAEIRAEQEKVIKQGEGGVEAHADDDDDDNKELAATPRRR